MQISGGESMKKQRASIKERLCHSLDIQPDVFPRQSFIEIRGRNSVTVRGCGRVKVYTDTEIKLTVGGGIVCIRGRRLCCTAYHRGAAVIDGEIQSVSFEEAGK